MEEAFPRPLTDREADVLQFLLAEDFAGRAALAEQARTVVVTARWPDEATVDLRVTAADAPVAEVSQRVAVETTTADDALAILLHVIDGRMSTLEVVGQNPLPSEFPPASELRPPL